MTNPGADDRVTNSNNNDDKVIITAILLGIGGGVGLLFLCVPAVTSAFLFSLGGSAMLYRFLGGTSGSTLEIKGLKASASAAILIAGTIGLNSLLENQLKNPNFIPRRCTAFEPDSSRWFPINSRTGLPEKVKYSGTDRQVVDNPDIDFSKINLLLNNSGEVSNRDFKLGRLPEEELKKSISIDIEFNNDNDLHYSGAIKDKGLSEVFDLPFKIKVLCVGDEDCSPPYEVKYQLLRNSKDEVINNKVIGVPRRSINSGPSRGFQVFQLDGEWYFITVLKSCTTPPCQGQDPFVSFVVGRINTKIKFSK